MSSINLQTPIIYPSVVFFSIGIVTIKGETAKGPDCAHLLVLNIRAPFGRTSLLKQ